LAAQFLFRETDGARTPPEELVNSASPHAFRRVREELNQPAWPSFSPVTWDYPRENRRQSVDRCRNTIPFFFFDQNQTGVSPSMPSLSRDLYMLCDFSLFFFFLKEKKKKKKKNHKTSFSTPAKKNQTQKTTIRIKKKRQKRKESVLKKKTPHLPSSFL
jgi:hypothetical protein